MAGEDEIKAPTAAPVGVTARHAPKSHRTASAERGVKAPDLRAVACYLEGTGQVPVGVPVEPTSSQLVVVGTTLCRVVLRKGALRRSVPTFLIGRGCRGQAAKA